MIELIPAEHDDAAFLSLAQRIMNGAVAALEIRDVFLVHVDNWFDHKWLRWWSRRGEELRVPTFTPNRVRSEKHFVWDVDKSAWTSVDTTKRRGCFGEQCDWRRPSMNSQRAIWST